MKPLKWYLFLLMLLVMLVGIVMISACDSAKDVVDEATGNRAVKQYHRSKKRIDKIAEQQVERYDNILPDESEEDE
jgi:cell division protein FtsW (lipid II flippase)